MKLDKIFVIHFEPLSDRKIYLDSILGSYNIPYEYIISNIDSDSKSNIDDFYKVDLSIWNRELTIGEICVSINHFIVYDKISKGNYNNCLIIEDDAVFKDNFNLFIDKILIELENTDSDMCFVSDGCNLHSGFIESNKHIYYSDTSRTVCGYIINAKCVDKVLDSLPFSKPIDWHLNQIKEKLNLKYYWSEPTIIRQGSEGIYKSNLRDKIK